MPYVLSTTYPSDQGLAAAEYACGLAVAMGSAVRLVHGYTVPVTFGEMPLPVMPAEDARNLAAGQMDAATQALRRRFPSLDISSELVYGDLADVLEETAQKEAPVITVVGNDEAADIDGWIGSHASDMLRGARHPVLAVPQTAGFRKPENVCIAVDSRSLASGATVTGLLHLQARLDFQITVLHIRAEDDEPAAFASSALGQQLQHADFVELSADGAIDGAIAGFVASNGMDWLAVIPHHYGFWEGLFHRSHTTHMLHIAQLPILALH